jgi:hypothetical protein
LPVQPEELLVNHQALDIFQGIAYGIFLQVKAHHSCGFIPDIEKSDAFRRHTGILIVLKYQKTRFTGSNRKDSF